MNPTPNEILQTILTYENETISDTKQIDLSKWYSGIYSPLIIESNLNSKFSNIQLNTSVCNYCCVLSRRLCYHDRKCLPNMVRIMWTKSYGPNHMDQMMWTKLYGPYQMAIIIQSYDLCFTFNLQSTGTFKVFEAEFKNGQTRCWISKSKYSVSFLIIWFYIIWFHLIWSISYGTHTLNWPKNNDFLKF